MNKLKLFIGCNSLQTFKHLDQVEKLIEGVDIDLLEDGDIKIQPILRSLEDITDKVIIEVIQAKFGDRRTKLSINQRNASEAIYYRFYDTKYKVTGINLLDFQKLNAEQLSVLIENHYDVFNMIQSGEAIDEKEFNKQSH